jgi:hypothetical protein
MKSPAAKGGTSLPEGSGGRAPPSSGECREDYVINFLFVKSQQLMIKDSENAKRVSRHTNDAGPPGWQGARKVHALCMSTSDAAGPEDRRPRIGGRPMHDTGCR